MRLPLRHLIDHAAGAPVPKHRRPESDPAIDGQVRAVLNLIKPVAQWCPTNLQRRKTDAYYRRITVNDFNHAAKRIERGETGIRTRKVVPEAARMPIFIAGIQHVDVAFPARHKAIVRLPWEPVRVIHTLATTPLVVALDVPLPKPNPKAPICPTVGAKSGENPILLSLVVDGDQMAAEIDRLGFRVLP